MRKRAGIVFLCKKANEVLLMYRKKGKREYWIVPGGRLEEGESFEQAARREIYEELGVLVDKMSNFCEISRENHLEKYFIVDYASNEKIDFFGEGDENNCEDNVYLPEWVAIGKIKYIRLLPVQLKRALVEHFKD